MVNTIHILDYNDNIIRLIKRYHITLLNIFPTVLEILIREYVDDIIEVNLIQNTCNIKIIVSDQYINCNPISFSFVLADNSIIYISSNIIQSLSWLSEYKYMWQKISNKFLKDKYNMNKFYNETRSGMLWSKTNTYTYSYAYDNDLINIINAKLFKNTCIMMHILVKHIRKKIETY